jgi:phosphoribulokinase
MTKGEIDINADYECNRDFKEIIARSPYVFVLGVAGDSGSGKTTFTHAVRTVFGEDLVDSISLDDYHRYNRSERAQIGLTPLDPGANDLTRLERDVAALKRGETIKKPVYNHNTGRFDQDTVFTSKKILILEGLHPLYTPVLRELLDFSIFVDPVREVKYQWKIKRDVIERGYNEKDVLMEIERREPDFERFILPQKEYADAIVSIRPSKYETIPDVPASVYQIVLSQCRMSPPLSDIDLMIDLHSILALSDRNFLLEFIRHEQNGKRMGDLVIDGELSSHVVACLEQRIEDQTRVRPVRIFRDRDYVTAGEITQLILCWRIIHRRISREPC